VGKSGRIWLTALLAVAMVAAQVPSYLTGASPFAAAAVVILDQTSPAGVVGADGSGQYILGLGRGSRAAQTVTAGLSGLLKSIESPIGCSATGVVRIEIQGVTAAGLPDDVVKASAQWTPSDPPSPQLMLTPSVFFNAGDRFAIVYSEISGDPSQLCLIAHGADGDGYPAGAGYTSDTQNPLWSSLSPANSYDDWPFKTYVDTAVVDIAINGDSVNETDPAHPQFSVNLVNFGPDAATGTTVTYTFTGPATINGWNQTQPGTCTHTATTLTCPVAPFDARAGYSNTIFVDRTSVGTITETATVHANERDPRSANNSASAAAAGDVLYSVDAASDGLSTIDLATNQSTFIGRLDPDITKLTTPIAMSVRPSDKTIFVWNNSDAVPTGVLLTVDTCTGLATKVNAATAPQGQLSAISFRSDGALFGVDDALYSIDPVTGVRTLIGTSLGSSLRVAGAEFDPATGVLYGLELNGSRLVTINTTTGVATVVGSLSTAVGVTGSIVFAPDGHLIGSGIDGTLFDLDKTTAAVSNVRTIAGSPAMQGLGFAPPCARSDISASIAAVPATVPPGTTVTLAPAAKNLGPDAATGVIIDLSIPNALTLGTLGTGCAVAVPILQLDVIAIVIPTSYVVECTIGALASGATATASVQVTPAVVGAYQVLAYAAAAQRDLNGDNNAASATVTSVVGLIGVASCKGVILPDATVDLLSGTTVVDTTFAAPDGSYGFAGVASNTTFGLRYTSADGLVVCQTTAQTNDSGTGQVAPPAEVPNLHNSTWPTAYALNPGGAPVQDYIATPRDAWFKVSIGPSQQIVVSLRDCQFDCSLVLYTDIAAAAAALQTGSIQNVQQTQQQISPAELSPAELSPAELSPAELSPAELSPAELSPAELSPAELSPAELSPAAYSSAQTESLLAISAHAGLSPELIVRNTWEHTGNFYVRVLSHTGDPSTQPFTVSARVLPGACVGVDLTKMPSTLVGGAASTIYITNSSRLASTATMTVAQFMTRLAAFATKNGGVVIDLAGDSGIQANYATWDAHKGCAIAANTVADSIHDLIGRYPNLRYITLAGGDNVIPFRRVPDLAALGDESTYHVPVLDSSESQAALKSGYFLSQDFYASPAPILRGNLRIDLPRQAIGRLVESLTDMTAMLDAYDGVNGVAHPATAVSTGYDFIADLAHDLQSTFGTEGLSVSTLIEEAGLGPKAPTAWTATQLRSVLFGASTYGIYAINGHFSANRALAADYATLVGSEEVAALPASDLRFRNALFLSMGCHAAYSIVDPDGIPNLTQTLAWAEALNARGATVVGGTGYGYADTEFVQYSELVISNTAKALGAAGGPIAIGDALRAAKTSYLMGLAAPAGIDAKAAAEATLYGLPMMKFAVPTPASGTTDGTSLELSNGSSAGLQFVEPGLTYTTTLKTDTVAVAGSTDTMQLSYYTSNGDVQVSPLQPILPRSVTPLSLPNTVVLRGGALVSARYTETSPFLPRTDVAATEERGQLPTAFASVYTPLRLFSLNQIAGRSLVVTPAQYLTDGITGTARLYDAAHLRIRLYTSTRIDASALASAPSINNVVLTPAPNGVHVDAVIGGLTAAGLEDVLFTYTTGADPTTHAGTWSSLSLRDGDLSADRYQSAGAGFSEHVSGDIVTTTPGAVRLLIQAVSGNALVSMASDAGAYFRLLPVNATSAAPKAPSALTFVTPPTASTTYGGNISATVRLTTGGSGQDGRVVDFSFGGHHARAVTAGGGLASAHFTANFDPVGSPYLFRVSFAEDADLFASSLTADIAIAPATSTLTAAPLNVQLGGSAILDAFLSANGKPLGEELVVVTVKGNGKTVVQRALLTNGFGHAQFDTRSFGSLPSSAYIASLTYGGSDFYTPATTDVSFVVYDASTGGGWILTTSSTTPAGTVPLPAGKKANFGFNAKYSAGSTVPSGNAIFQLKEASLDFQSRSIDGLALSSTTAQVTGSGTINGAGSFRFQITATQGSPDRFEIRIWDPAASTGNSFDHPKYIASNAVGGGSIKIH
jgi:hypothetical protein